MLLLAHLLRRVANRLDPPMTPGEWVHVVGTSSGTVAPDGWQMYVNGVRVS